MNITDKNIDGGKILHLLTVRSTFYQRELARANEDMQGDRRVSCGRGNRIVGAGAYQNAF